MSETLDEDLYQRTLALLEPGDIELIGCLVHSSLTSDQDLEMQELTIAINEIIAAAAGVEESYIEAGNDDPDFSSNQFQGLTLEDDAFVWECQQLLRDGTFDLVFYYEAETDQDAVVTEIEALDDVDRVTAVP